MRAAVRHLSKFARSKPHKFVRACPSERHGVGASLLDARRGRGAGAPQPNAAEQAAKSRIARRFDFDSRKNEVISTHNEVFKQACGKKAEQLSLLGASENSQRQVEGAVGFAPRELPAEVENRGVQFVPRTLDRRTAIGFYP